MKNFIFILLICLVSISCHKQDCKDVISKDCKNITTKECHDTTYKKCDYVEIRTGCICNDGTSSSATGSGACSGHNGVKSWLTTKQEVNCQNITEPKCRDIITKECIDVTKKECN